MDTEATKHLWEIDHNYYCSSGETNECESWQDFLDEWDKADKDYNFLFRFDVRDDNVGWEQELAEGTRLLRLYYILQRKGLILEVQVTFQENEEEVVKAWLQGRFDYLKELWQPLG